MTVPVITIITYYHLKAVADKTLKPEVGVDEALAAMECAQKILASIKRHKWD